MKCSDTVSNRTHRSRPWIKEHSWRCSVHGISDDNIPCIVSRDCQVQVPQAGGGRGKCYPIQGLDPTRCYPFTHANGADIIPLISMGCVRALLCVCVQKSTRYQHVTQQPPQTLVDATYASSLHHAKNADHQIIQKAKEMHLCTRWNISTVLKKTIILSCLGGLGRASYEEEEGSNFSLGGTFFLFMICEKKKEPFSFISSPWERVILDQNPS